MGYGQYSKTGVQYRALGYFVKFFIVTVQAVIGTYIYVLV